MASPERERRVPPCEAVLCDLDNVVRFYDLTEVARLEAVAGLPVGTTAEIAYAPERDLPLLLGRSTREEWRRSVAAGLRAFVPAARAEVLAREFAYAPSFVDPAVVALLRRVRVPLVLVTNAAPWLDEDLVRLGIADLAAHVVNSSAVGIAKPDPGIYELASECVEVPPARCLFVDDRAENLLSAAALGMRTVHYREVADLRTALTPVLFSAA
ncbi:HAD-IA family hydrolase [Streptomyces sp. NPDC060194]|uniref:HAD-IA family hydrolase n=1 Tax=Streptomyces sp. NPDC060194 TaxID=3347069 RepID=UPI00365B24D9